MRKLLLSSIVLALVGCNSNDVEQLDENNQVAEYLSDHLGLYQTAYEESGQAMLARLTITNMGATLILTDDTENSNAYAGTVGDENLAFDSVAECSFANSGFNCTLASETINLTYVNVTEDNQITQLEGDYKVVSASNIIDVSIDNEGAFTTQYDGCEVNGTFNAENNFFSVSSILETCSSEEMTGIAFLNSDDADPDSIEIFFPNGVLSGEWIKV